MPAFNNVVHAVIKCWRYYQTTHARIVVL